MCACVSVCARACVCESLHMCLCVCVRAVGQVGREGSCSTNMSGAWDLAGGAVPKMPGSRQRAGLHPQLGNKILHASAQLGAHMLTCSAMSDSATHRLQPRQALSMRLSCKNPGVGFAIPSPRDLPDPGIKGSSAASEGRFFTTEPPGKSQHLLHTRAELPFPQLARNKYPTDFSLNFKITKDLTAQDKHTHKTPKPLRGANLCMKLPSTSVTNRQGTIFHR